MLPEALLKSVGTLNCTIAALSLLTLLAGAMSVSAQENQPILIETHSIIPTKPVWFDDGTVVYKTCKAIRVSSAQYAPNPIGHNKYDIAGGKELKAATGEYGSLSQDGRLILLTERNASQGIDQGMGHIVVSHIKLIDTASKAVITDYSCPEAVQGASLSPDGQVIIFATQGDLWRLHVGEPGAQIVVHSKEKNRFPRHSLNGKKLYFIRETNDGTDFFAFDFTSNAVVQMSKGLNPVSAFSLSPDGKFIVYASMNELQVQSQYNGSIWILNLETAKTRRLTQGGADQYPSYSPNGERIAFQRQQGFYADSGLKAFQVVVVPFDLTIK